MNRQLRRQIARTQGSAQRQRPEPQAEPDFNSAVTLFYSGRTVEAERLCRQLLEIHPDHEGALHLLGLVAFNAGRYETAVELLERAAIHKGNDPGLLTNLAIALHRSGRSEDAERLFRQAIQVSPGFVEAYRNLSVLLQAAGRHEEEVHVYELLLLKEPGQADTHARLGDALQKMGKLDEAVLNYRRAIDIRPDFAEGHCSLGDALHSQGRYEEALHHYRRSVEIRPDYADGHYSVGNALMDKGRTELAIHHLRRSIEIRSAPKSLIAFATALPVIPLSMGEIHGFRARWEEEVSRLFHTPMEFDDSLKELLFRNFHCAYHGLDDRPFQELIARLLLSKCKALSWTAPHCAEDAGASPLGRRLRIGFISRFFHNHTIARLNRGLIRHLSRERFDVTAIQFEHSLTPERRAVADADRTVNLSGTHLNMQQQLAGLELDILFYTDIGMEPLTYRLAFSRLAPVQCVTWGHPVTTGIPTIDYFLSSDSLEPPGAEEHYSETLVRMKALPTYYSRLPSLESPPTKEEFGFDGARKLYVCPQSLFKLHPDFDGALADILRQDSRGALVLIEGKHPDWSELLRERFSRENPDVAERVAFLPRQSSVSFLRLLSVADALIDPPGFGGGNTSYEAFSLGAPIVTWPGPFMRGRVTSACYRRMDMDDCIAADMDDYVRKAVRLANDREWRVRLEESIRAKNHRILEDVEAVREMEKFFEDAVLRAHGR